MKWRNISDTSMCCDPWTICKVRINGVKKYELWHDKRPVTVGIYSTFEQAKAAAEGIEMEGQA